MSGKSGRWVGGVSAVLVLGVGVLALAPAAARAADHRDASITKTNGQLDINDVYAFQSPSNASHTVLITTVVPFSGVFNLPLFSSTGTYDINIDNTGDLVPDVTFRFGFSAPNRLGVQKVAVQLIKHGGAQMLAQGLTGNIMSAAQGVTVTASLFSDPFFFDFNAFERFLVSGSPNEFCGKGMIPANDFFLPLNTMALVLDVPTSLLLAASKNPMIGVWATTYDATGKQFDRMGRPAVNTALILNSAMKNVFNAGMPSTDVANFTTTLVAQLMAYGNGSSSAGIASVLLPDVLTFNTSSTAGFLNGRQLADDVIDIEFGVFLAHYPAGAITTDCIGKHTDYRSQFPYLGIPHMVAPSP